MVSEVAMLDAQETKTVSVKACLECGGGLLEYDNFCRWCGAQQPPLPAGERPVASSRIGSASSDLAGYRTSALDESGVRAGMYRRVSGPLVSAVIKGVVEGSTEEHNRHLKRAILALISIPIWLIIVLLSPLDAYAAAKNLLR